ncbi:MAG: hypothetical protein ACR2PO_15800 [Methyloligellaceae bacterium]
MKAFMASLVLIVAITAVAAIILGGLDMSAEQIFSSQNGSVRL